MPSTNAASIVPIAEAMTDLVLDPRRRWLRKREPRALYVLNARKKLAARVAKPFDLLIAIAFADIDDGAPLAAVLAPWYAIVGAIRERAMRRTARRCDQWTRRFLAVSKRETQAESALTQAQLLVASCLHDEAALLEALDVFRVASREYRAVYDELEALIDERCAALRKVA